MCCRQRYCLSEAANDASKGIGSPFFDYFKAHYGTIYEAALQAVKDNKWASIPTRKAFANSPKAQFSSLLTNTLMGVFGIPNKSAHLKGSGGITGFFKTYGAAMAYKDDLALKIVAPPDPFAAAAEPQKQKTPGQKASLSLSSDRSTAQRRTAG